GRAARVAERQYDERCHHELQGEREPPAEARPQARGAAIREHALPQLREGNLDGTPLHAQEVQDDERPCRGQEEARKRKRHQAEPAHPKSPAGRKTDSTSSPTRTCVGARTYGIARARHEASISARQRSCSRANAAAMRGDRVTGRLSPLSQSTRTRSPRQGG